MAWIESHQALGQHPKTLAFATALHCSLPAAVGYLHYLWWWALDYAQDGAVTPRSQPLVARACHWRGNAERFWEALLVAGFADKEGDDMRIHDWSDYAGRLLDKRRKDAERKADVRRTSGPDTPDVRRTSGAANPDDRSPSGVPTNLPTNQPTGQTQPTVPNQPEKTAGRQRARAREETTTTSPTLLAEHLMRLAQEQASRAMPSQPFSNSSTTYEGPPDAQR